MKRQKQQPKKNSLSITNYFVPQGKTASELIHWAYFDCDIRDRNGKSVFTMNKVKAPGNWSTTAVEIAASKYFRKGKEKSIEDLVERVVSAITQSAKTQKYFSNFLDLKIFKEELKFLLFSQRASFNSPVWFNCGLYQSYKTQSDAGNWVWNEQKKKPVFQKNAYTNPQVSACFIQSVEDDLSSIFSLIKNEAHLFKFGSGSGTNFTALRSKYEPLSGGGHSSGLLSFLEVFDRSAGSIKSGGVSRRAAKMVCLDITHPEISDFISWKMIEEKKAHALIAAGYDHDFEGEAYRTISGQNSNNSVRVTDAFMKAVNENLNWNLKAPSSGKIVKTVPAKDLWQEIITAAWSCADPGLQFHDTIQRWHTCPESGDINASNPCSEYMFLDDSACNLASLNLLRFVDDLGNFDLEGYLHAVRILFLAQEILVDFASYPTELICRNSHNYRPLGLGFAGLGALLMRKGIPYDSAEGRGWAGVLTALLHGQACLTSAEIAKIKGPFAGYKNSKSTFLKVMAKHQSALRKIERPGQKLKCFTKAQELWDEVISKGKKHGFRNAQMTLMAPTGTIGLVMDTETTGVEPEFSLVEHKKLVGGGVLESYSQSVTYALKALGYETFEIDEISRYATIEHTIEGAPHLKPEHYPVFDCAQVNGVRGRRSLTSEAHLKMMAAIQPFLSGAISKTVNLPHSATINEISRVYHQAWEMGLKAIAIYRDGCKLSQPLTSKTISLVSEKNEVFHKNPLCPECGQETELTGGCFRCQNCGFTTGCVS